MFTTHTSSNKRKGMASILGTIIFIGIMFSAIIPMALMIKQADLLYTQELHNVDTLDTEKAEEVIVVTAYPDSNDMITVRVYNKGNVPITVERVWINNDKHQEDTPISSTDSGTFGPYEVNLDEVNFDVTVTTSRGNIFHSSSGTLSYSYSDGTWISPNLGICVSVVNVMGRYRIHVVSLTEGIDYDEWYNEEGTGMDFNDIIQTFLLPDLGINDAQYQITVTKKVGGSWENLPFSPVTVIIDWPNGSPLKYVYFNGE